MTMQAITRDEPMTAVRPTLAYATDAARWDAVRRRDQAADGAFFYSVVTTGVYCRPSCPSRLPRRENVGFHASPAAAETAGFRPCKRTAARTRRRSPSARPRRSPGHAGRSNGPDATPGLPRKALAKAAGMSRFHFHRVFKAVTGVTPKAYADAHRARRVRSALTEAGSVTAAIYDAGFNSSGRFYAASDDLLGMTPSDFRTGGTGAAIRFAVGECSPARRHPGGRHPKGRICAIMLGDDPDALLRDLQDRFPKARLIGGDKDFEQLVAKVVGLVETPGQNLDLPLDVRGTAFQQRVWQALRKIPAGATATYTQIAKRIGRPKAVRAVAQACASNPVAVAIPCHRVVRTDGSLSGYRWGVARKRALLDKEAAA